VNEQIPSGKKVWELLKIGDMIRVIQIPGLHDHIGSGSGDGYYLSENIWIRSSLPESVENLEDDN
jgi:hypothetical protein